VHKEWLNWAEAGVNAWACGCLMMPQSIGAYNTSVEVDGETKTICFLDTPGHEAFSAMRARGAQVRWQVVVAWRAYTCIMWRGQARVVARLQVEMFS
jgi:hypothetical protein